MMAIVDRLVVDYFDGRSARPQSVRIELREGVLYVEGEALSLQVPARQVRWPERTRHGARVAHLPQGASLHAPDARAWDDWAAGVRLGESVVVRWQQSWRATGVVLGLLVVLGVVGYLWGVPALARGVLLAVPTRVDRQLGEKALASIEEAKILLPSTLPLERQKQIRAEFEQALVRAWPQGERPEVELRFYTSALVEPEKKRTRIGANAFALPGGLMVVTDDLAQLLQERDDVMLGVLGHELGHVQRRHGMRMVVQVGVMGAVISAWIGDFSSLLAAVPTLLGQTAYSRDFEREADDDAVTFLRANRLSPLVMVTLFERLRAQRGGEDVAELERKGAKSKDAQSEEEPDYLGIALASHPADRERMRRFREAAAAK